VRKNSISRFLSMAICAFQHFRAPRVTKQQVIDLRNNPAWIAIYREVCLHLEASWRLLERTDDPKVADRVRGRIEICNWIMDYNPENTRTTEAPESQERLKALVQLIQTERKALKEKRSQHTH
jgi:hypothetical protein